MKTASIYARVSPTQQKEEKTIKETHLFAHWALLWGQTSMGRAG